MQCRGGSLEARMNHLQEEMEEVRKLKQIGKYSGRHKGEGEKDQCQKCVYKHEPGQKCPADNRTCNRCRDKGHFITSKLCRKKKAAWRVKEEQKETSSESSNFEGEQDVNRVIRDQVWPGMCTIARKRYIRNIGRRPSIARTRARAVTDRMTRQTTPRPSTAGPVTRARVRGRGGRRLQDPRQRGRRLQDPRQQGQQQGQGRGARQGW